MALSGTGDKWSLGQWIGAQLGQFVLQPGQKFLKALLRFARDVTHVRMVVRFIGRRNEIELVQQNEVVTFGT